jgi:hypothetical protein
MSDNKSWVLGTKWIPSDTLGGPYQNIIFRLASLIIYLVSYIMDSKYILLIQTIEYLYKESPCQ